MAQIRMQYGSRREVNAPYNPNKMMLDHPNDIGFIYPKFSPNCKSITVDYKILGTNGMEMWISGVSNGIVTNIYTPGDKYPGTSSGLSITTTVNTNNIEELRFFIPTSQTAYTITNFERINNSFYCRGTGKGSASDRWYAFYLNNLVFNY